MRSLLRNSALETVLCPFPRRFEQALPPDLRRKGEVGEVFKLRVEAFLVIVELLCLPSVEVFLRGTFPSHCKQRSSTVSKKARIVNKKLDL